MFKAQINLGSCHMHVLRCAKYRLQKHLYRYKVQQGVTTVNTFRDMSFTHSHTVAPLLHLRATAADYIWCVGHTENEMHGAASRYLNM